MKQYCKFLKKLQNYIRSEIFYFLKYQIDMKNILLLTSAARRFSLSLYDL